MRACLWFACFLLSVPVYAAQLPLHLIKLPDGFQISVFAANVDNARSMAWNGSNTLYVGTRSAGKVYALVDSDGDYRADRRFTIASGLNMPNGIVYDNGDLYVAEVHRIIKYSGIDQRLANPPDPVVIYSELPVEEHHGWRYLNLGPDGKLYISIGVPCNVCDEEGYGVLARLDKNGKNFEVIARGVRNSVGFTWHSQTRQLWFTDNGRDWMGDDSPPDELNRLSRTGEHFGFPYCHGDSIRDPDYGKGKRCQDYTAPVQNLGAHVASLGLHIYSENQFPSQYRHQVFIAEHGSWNRSSKVGYRVSLVRLNEKQQAVSYENFATGWLQGERAWGRPVDIKPLPDGSLLVSDDVADAIYRITYQFAQ